jgi:hypothetical protein
MERNRSWVGDWQNRGYGKVLKNSSLWLERIRFWGKVTHSLTAQPSLWQFEIAEKEIKLQRE